MPSAQLPRIRLDDAGVQQLAMLVANMLEDHLRALATCREPTAQQPEDGLHERKQQDHRHPHAEDSLRLHSAVEHGSSETSSRKY